MRLPSPRYKLLGRLACRRGDTDQGSQLGRRRLGVLARREMLLYVPEFLILAKIGSGLRCRRDEHFILAKPAKYPVGLWLPIGCELIRAILHKHLNGSREN